MSSARRTGATFLGAGMNLFVARRDDDNIAPPQQATLSPLCDPCVVFVSMSSYFARNIYTAISLLRKQGIKELTIFPTEKISCSFDMREEKNFLIATLIVMAAFLGLSNVDLTPKLNC